MAYRAREPVIALLLTLCLLTGGCLGRRASDREDPVTPVVVVAACHDEVVTVIRASGVLSACREIHLTPRVPGRLQAVLVKVGDHVKSGQVLLRLEAREYEAQLGQAEAAVEAARAALARAEKGPSEQELAPLRAAVTQARAAAERTGAAWEGLLLLYQEGAVSRQEVDNAEAQYRAAMAQLAAAEQQLEMAAAGTPEEGLAAARAQLRQAEAARELAQLQLEGTLMVAPWAGYIWYVKATPGEMLSVASPVVGLVDIDQLHLVVGLSDASAVRVKPGLEVRMWVPAAGAELMGTIDHVAPAADPRTRLFQVRVSVDNPGHALRPGMFAEVSIPESERRNVLVVPREAVLRVGDRDVVFVVEGSVARERTVVTGSSDGARVEILSGLKAQDMVVIVGHHFLTDGSRVSVERAGER